MDKLPPSKPSSMEQKQLSALVNSLGVGVIATDQNVRITVYNGMALNVLDRNTAIEGLMIGDVLKLVNKDNVAVDASELVQNSKTLTVNRDYRIPLGNDNFMNLYLSIAPVLGTGNTKQGYVLTVRDISHEKRLEEEREEFISVISHELRTPVAIAEGNLSNALILTEKGGDNSVIIKGLSQAHDQIMFLGSIVNDLSTLSRAERGILAITIEPINILELVQKLAETYRDSAEDKGLHLNVVVDPNLELIYSSNLYVREIMQNLITNSIKYTPAGVVTIGAEARPDGVEMYVSDTGIGISPTDQEKIFHKFFRSDDFRTRQNKGTGLGLYVSMKLIKLINAKIVLESELNKGSSFRLFVPNLKPVEPPPAHLSNKIVS